MLTGQPLYSAQYVYTHMTETTVVDLLYRFIKDHYFRPDYLFLSVQGNCDFHIVLRDLTLRSATGPQQDTPPVLKIYMGLHVVVLPTLLDKTLLFGMLALEK